MGDHSTSQSVWIPTKSSVFCVGTHHECLCHCSCHYYHHLHNHCHQAKKNKNPFHTIQNPGNIKSTMKIPTHLIFLFSIFSKKKNIYLSFTIQESFFLRKVSSTTSRPINILPYRVKKPQLQFYQSIQFFFIPVKQSGGF